MEGSTWYSHLTFALSCVIDSASPLCTGCKFRCSTAWTQPGDKTTWLFKPLVLLPSLRKWCVLARLVAKNILSFMLAFSSDPEKRYPGLLANKWMTQNVSFGTKGLNQSIHVCCDKNLETRNVWRPVPWYITNFQWVHVEVNIHTQYCSWLTFSIPLVFVILRPMLCTCIPYTFTESAWYPGYPCWWSSIWCRVWY